MPIAHRLLIHHGRPCPLCGVIMRVHRNGKGHLVLKPDSPTREHLLPRSRVPAMGTIIACHQCNSDKGNRTLKEWHLALSTEGDVRARSVQAWMSANRSTMLRLND